MIQEDFKSKYSKEHFRFIELVVLTLTAFSFVFSVYGKHFLLLIPIGVFLFNILFAIIGIIVLRNNLVGIGADTHFAKPGWWAYHSFDINLIIYFVALIFFIAFLFVDTILN